jgi:hypothetical protein
VNWRQEFGFPAALMVAGLVFGVFVGSMERNREQFHSGRESMCIELGGMLTRGGCVRAERVAP